jgi:hypothetical protein
MLPVEGPQQMKGPHRPHPPKGRHDPAGEPNGHTPQSSLTHDACRLADLARPDNDASGRHVRGRNVSKESHVEILPERGRKYPV